MAGVLSIWADSGVGDKPILTRTLVPATTVVVGSGKDADLVVNDPLISPSHCEIRCENDGAYLQDCGSLSGTFRNSSRVTTEVPLRDGDRIKLGSMTLRVQLALDPKTAESCWPNAPTRADAVAADSMDVHAPSKSSARQRTPFIGQAGVRKGQSKIDVTVPIEAAVAKGGSQRPQLNLAMHRDRSILGRDTACELLVNHPTVSRRHVEITRREDLIQVRDLRSANGTFVNGQRVLGRARLRPSDRLKVGAIELVFDGKRFTSEALLSGADVDAAGTRIDLMEVGRCVPHRHTQEPIWLIQDLTLTIHPQEFIGVFGTAGCGKSTAMDAINGRRPATTGIVLYNGQNLYNNFDSLKAGIGYVPQELIFHADLPVGEALKFSAALRLPPDTNQEEIERNVDRALEQVALVQRKDVLIRDLSGGQKKRVSIANELVSRPSVLFLDEATSGLDAKTESEMMRLFRELAHRGVTTLCITHYADSLEQCDKLVYLIGGRLAFFGSPAELKDHFRVRNIREVYWQETRRTPDEWAKRFADSPTWRRNVAPCTPDAGTANEQKTKVEPGQALEQLVSTEQRRQFVTLSKRYVSIMLNDRRTLIMLLVLAPIIGLLIRFRFGQEANGPSEVLRQLNLSFTSAIAMFFLGIFGSIREVVKELAVYRHERFVGLRVVPYLASKATILGSLNVIQAFIMFLCVARWGPIDLVDGAALGLILTFLLIALSGTFLGLAVSCAVDTSDKAVVAMVILIMPQILFTNALGALDGFSGVLAKLLVPTYWGLDAVNANLEPALFASGAAMNEHAFVGSLVALGFFSVLYAALAAVVLRRKDGILGKPYVMPNLDSGREAFASLSRRLSALLGATAGRRHGVTGRDV